MSFNRSGYIGRAPGDSSIVLAKQYFQPTGAGKTFTFTAGYDPGLLDVYRNGVKLINVLDYAATDGETIILDTPVGVGSTVQVVAYKAFNLTEVNSSGADFNVGTNLYVQSGFGSFAQGITANQIDVSGIGTIGIGSFVDINVSGAATVAGTLVAGSFSGDGSALTGVGQTLNVRTESLTVAGVSTFTGALNATSVVSSGPVSGTTGTFSAAVNVDATTDSTSSTTGALIVDGGLGVAKNVYIGAGLSVAGTLTYEDVTNVDSVGMVTAKSGLNVSGGEVTVGSAVTIGSAGVTTFIGAAGVGVTITPSTGKVEATTYYGDGSNLSNITTTTINNNGQDKLITGSTNANTLEAESTLTFDGSTLTVTGAQTVTGDLFFDNGSDAGKDILWDVSEDALIFNDSTYLKMGSDGDCSFEHTGSAFLITNTTGSFFIRPKLSENGITLVPDGEVTIAYDNSTKLATTNDGTVTTGIATATGGHITGGGEFKVGTGVTIASTSGVATFSKDVTFLGENDKNVKWSAANAGFEFQDNALLKIGASADLQIYHDATNSQIWNATGTLRIRGDSVKINNAAANKNAIVCESDIVTLYYDNSAKLATTNDGVVVTGIMTASAGVNYDGLLSEKFNTTAGKLSDNTNIDLEDGMVHYFSTQETTTSTPNIRYSSSKTLNNMLTIGDTVSVTVITTAAAAGYSASWQVDGSAVTEEWNGAAAPSEGGSGGYDVYTITLLKTAANTYTVLANLSNFA